MQTLAKNLGYQGLIACLAQENYSDKDAELQALLESISNNSKFKYSRLFAIGIFSLLECSNPDLVKDEKQLAEVLQKIATGLNISQDKFSKDLELYRSNLEKMQQTLVVMADICQQIVRSANSVVSLLQVQSLKLLILKLLILRLQFLILLRMRIWMTQ